MLKKSKFMMLVLVTLLLFVITGCGTSEKTETQEKKSDQAAVVDKFPEKPIKIIVATSAGGGMDNTIRQIQPFWEKALGGTIVVENKPGGASTIGTKLVADSDPDGYTILSTGTPHYQFGIILQGTDYTMDDLVPLGPFVTEASIIRVKKDAPWNNLNELIEYVKSKPPKTVKVSVSELSSPNFITMKMIEEATGVQFNIVPFGGGGPARTALLGGQVELTNAGVFNSLPIAQDTKVIAVHADKNLWPAITDNAKTINEQLGSNLTTLPTTYGLFVPAEIKQKYPDRYKKLVESLQKALQDPDYLAALKKTGEEGKSNVQDPVEYDKGLRKQYDDVLKYKDVLKEPEKK